MLQICYDNEGNLHAIDYLKSMKFIVLIGATHFWSLKCNSY